jgi:hypothetical protein
MMKLIYFIFSLFFCSNCFCQGKFFGGNGDGFAAAAIINVMLPLHVINFFGTANSNSNIVFWHTVSEENMLHFEIERSDDAVLFKKIGEVVAAGSNNGLTKYQFTDNRPAGWKYYYRLKQISSSGAYYYSVIILLINSNKNQEITVSPNPVINKAAIIFSGAETAVRKLFLFSSNGQLVDEFIVIGRNACIDLTGKATGLYFLINKESGTGIKIYKVIE